MTVQKTIRLFILFVFSIALFRLQRPQPAQAQTAWQPPIGIPAPPFGIEEVAPTWPSAWPGGEATNAYYIDNTHPNATDDNNPFGTPNRPLQSIPEQVFPAGTYIEIHGGDYDDGFISMGFDCTAAQPCWVRGTPDNMPQISAMIVANGGMSYVIFEYLNFEGGSNGGIDISGVTDHVAVRHSTIHNKTFDRNTSGIGVGAYENETVRDIVIYNNLFANLGDWQATDDEDFHGVGPGMWGLDENSNAETYNIWIVDNTCYRVSGDCVQVNAGWGEGIREYLHHIYIGRNLAYQNRQSGFAIKQARDVIISQNIVHGHKAIGDQPGDGIVAIYEQDNLWILYNDLYDNNFGVRQSSGDGPSSDSTFIIGNIIHDNETGLDNCGHWSSPAGWGISLWWTGINQYIVNNTIYNTRGGIEIINGDGIGATVIENNIVADLNGLDYSNDGSDCGGFSVSPGSTRHFYNHTTPSLTVDNNLFAQTDGEPLRIDDFGTLADYQQTGQCADCLVGDPLFVDPASSNFALQNGSPAVDAGVANHAVYQMFSDRYGLDIRVDHAGQARPQGAGWDMGAFEGESDGGGNTEPIIYLPTVTTAFPNQTVDLPITFAGNGNDITTVAFAIAFEPDCFDFDAQDDNNDGTPNGITLAIPNSHTASFDLDALANGTLGVLIADVALPFSQLSDGALATLSLATTCAPTNGGTRIIPIGFGTQPAPSFGNTAGQSVAGIATGGTIEIVSGTPGDCNGDQQVDAGDVAALILEIFDGDGSDATGASGGTFAGDVVGCDANEDSQIDAGDVSCQVLLTFNGAGACSAETTTATSVDPTLTVATASAMPGETVTLPITLNSKGHALSSVAFSIDFDETMLQFDANDSNGDDIPDGVQFDVADGFVISALFDATDTDGELDVLIADVAPPLRVLDGGEIGRITLTIADSTTPPNTAVVQFSAQPTASFGSQTGQSITGNVQNGAVLINSTPTAVTTHTQQTHATPAGILMLLFATFTLTTLFYTRRGIHIL